MITKDFVKTQDSCNEELAIKLYDILHTKDIKRQTTLHWPIANRLGVHQAILLEIIHNWTEYNAHKGALSYFHEDNWWTSDTYERWFESYPAFGSVRTLQRLFKELENLDYIISCRPFGKNKNGTKFYRVNKAKVGSLLLEDSHAYHISDTTPRQNGKSDSTKWQEQPAILAGPSIYINNINKEENKKEESTHSTQDPEPVKVEVSVVEGHPVHLMKKKFNYTGMNEPALKEQVARIWQEEKPGNFVDLPSNRLDHKSWATFKANYLIQYGEAESLEMLRESLIYAREYDDRQGRDKFSWRKVTLTLGEWVNSSRTEKIFCLSSKHKHFMNHDPSYADKVQGVAFSNRYLDEFGVPLSQRGMVSNIVESADGVRRMEEFLKQQAAISDDARAKRQMQENQNQLQQGR